MALNGVAVEELMRAVRLYVSSEEFTGFTDSQYERKRGVMIFSLRTGNVNVQVSEMDRLWVGL